MRKNGYSDYTVFEAVNPVRKEIYVGVTTHPMWEAITILRAEQPACLKAWNFDDVTIFRSLEFNLSESDARAHIASYVRKRSPEAGYRYCFEKSLESA